MVARTSVEQQEFGGDSAGIRLTAEEFTRARNFDRLYRYEVVNDVLVVRPNQCHQNRLLSQDLGFRLYTYRLARNERLLTVYEEPVRTRHSIRRVDRAIWLSTSGEPNPRIDVPVILVDFVSAGRRVMFRDYLDRRDEYLTIGVKEYWVIDRFDRTMTVFTGAVDAPLETVVKESGVYSTPLLPGFALPLADILTEADKFPD